jgi:hypothetical protein
MEHERWEVACNRHVARATSGRVSGLRRMQVILQRMATLRSMRPMWRAPLLFALKEASIHKLEVALIG